jgi:protein-S-isoprenylcysteine O-methyltransferase Ste14
MYLATFIIFLSISAAAMSWLFLLLTIILIICFRQEALNEERYCQGIYGEKYKRYISQVPRWIGKKRTN